jgi:hypothetical protein
MTTDTFPFTPDSQNEMTPPMDDEPSGGRFDKRKMALGGGLVALVVAGGGFFLLSHGGGSKDAAQGVVPHGKAPAAAAPAGGGAKAGASGATRVKIRPYKGAPAGRDPFKPLVTAPAQPSAVPTTPSSSPTTPSVPIVGPGTGGTPPTTAPSGAPTPAPTTQPAPQTTLAFEGIEFAAPGNTPVVRVRYDGKEYRMKTGATAAGSLKVVSIEPDDSMAVFQVGDQIFDLHVGQVWVG